MKDSTGKKKYKQITLQSNELKTQWFRQIYLKQGVCNNHPKDTLLPPNMSNSTATVVLKNRGKTDTLNDLS